MSELRYNPIKREWVITATHRKNRTFKPPEDYCPFCLTADMEFMGEVTKDYDLVVFENKFPSLKTSPPEPTVKGSDLFPVALAKGVCEVIVYSPTHHIPLSQMSYLKFIKLIKVWKDRYIELGKLDFVEYVFIFENKGEEVGVTLHHPHGQIYAYPFIPPIPEQELKSAEVFFQQTGQCLFCAVLRQEVEDGSRIVAENDSFVALIPFFARYNYEVHIMAKEHLPSLKHFNEKHETDLAAILKIILQKYDNIYKKPFPYIMAIHQLPTNGTREEYAHFHIEFYPPLRAKDRLKYLAGSESGVGTFINDSLPEDKAKELRELPPFSLEDIMDQEGDEW